MRVTIVRLMMKVNAKQLLAINARGISFDERNVTWNQYDDELVAVKIEDDCVMLWIFSESGNVYEESREFSNDGWNIKGWSEEN
jgi:hypothetical protein